MDRPLLTPRMVRVDLWIAAITLALGTFVAVTHESVGEGSAVAADRAILGVDGRAAHAMLSPGSWSASRRSARRPSWPR